MDKLTLAPDADGYSERDGEDVISVALDGGGARYRRDKIGSSKSVSVRWTLNRVQYAYFRAFFVTTTKKGALPFLIDLVGESGLGPEEHQCSFVPGSVGLQAQKGLTYVVGAQLEATPVDHDTTTDEQLVYLYGLYGDYLETFINILDYIANDQLPAEFA